MSEAATPEAAAKATPPQAAQSAQTALYDLLARSWSFEVGISDVAIDAGGKAFGFALDDGRVALMPVDDPDSPLARMRVEGDTGRSIIRPREKPVASPILTKEVATGPALLVASKSLGLIAAGRDGRLHRITPRGQVMALTNRIAPIHAIATDGTGRIALARENSTDLHDEEGMARLMGVLTPEPANAIAFAPDDHALAVMLTNELLVGQPSQGYESYPLGGHGALGFSPDGAWLAGSNGSDGFWLLNRRDGCFSRLGNFRVAPTSIAFNGAAGAVFASGAFRTAGWSLASMPITDEASGALMTGRPGLVLVEKIATHPRRDLIAFGTANGDVSIAKVGQREEMALRNADGSQVTALRWSADGLHLAIGTAAGNAAIVTLPEQLFK